MKTPTFTPELLTPISFVDMGRYIVDDAYEMEELLSGQRMSLRGDSWTLTAYNGDGDVIPTPDQLLPMIGFRGWLDGVFVGGKLHAFDLLEFAGEDIRKQPRWRRCGLMTQWLVVKMERLLPVVPVRSFAGAEEKEAAFLAFHRAGAKGVAFKLSSDPYMPGQQGVNVSLKF